MADLGARAHVGCFWTGADPSMTSLEVERTAVRIAHRGFIQNQIFEVFGRVRRAWLLRNQPISFCFFLEIRTFLCGLSICVCRSRILRARSDFGSGL
jgi:hypothetical protein